MDYRQARRAADGTASARTEHGVPSAAGENPCNTSPAISILRSGVDSLYLSFRGKLHDEGQLRLEEARKAARSESDQEHPMAQVSVLDHLFEVLPTGGKLFRYQLRDHAFRVRLNRGGSKYLPIAATEIRSRYLTATGVAAAANELRLILSSFAVLEPGSGTTRLDLFVDFTGPFPLDSWPDGAWVTRADF